MAQRGDLLDPDELPTTRAESRGVSHRCAEALAFDEDQPDPRATPQSVATALSECLLKGGPASTGTQFTRISGPSHPAKTRQRFEASTAALAVR